MASGEVVIQSMWSPAITAVRTKGISCVYQPLKEGYRAWAAGFALPSTIKGYQQIWHTSSSTGSSRGGRVPTKSAGLLLSSFVNSQGKHGSLRVGLLDAR